MKDFTFQVPTRFVKEQGGSRKVGEGLKQMGFTDVLVVSSGDPFEQSLMETVKESLVKNGIRIHALTGVKPNPHLDLVYEGIKLCRENMTDGILAVGGGSVIDTAKAIAAGAASSCNVWDFFEKKAEIEGALPIGVILTYPATGSESSNVSVINNEEKGKKLMAISPCLIPKIVYMDPVITFSLPARMTARGIVDMFSHICERYFCEEQEIDVIDRMAEAVLHTLVKIGKSCIDSPNDYDLRSQLMWIGSIAQNNLLGLGRIQDWSVHALGNELSALFNSVHADTLSVIMPAWMRCVFRNQPERFARYARKVFGVSEERTIEEQAIEGICQTEKFFTELGMPVKISEIVKNLSENDIEKMTEQIPLKSDGTIGAVRKLDKNMIKSIYRAANM